MGTHPSINVAMPRVDLRVLPGGASAPVLGQLLSPGRGGARAARDARLYARFAAGAAAGSARTTAASAPARQGTVGAAAWQALATRVVATAAPHAKLLYGATVGR
jgi:hypothetical protein